MTAIIIEDEDIAVAALQRLLEKYNSFVHVIAVVGNGAEAIASIDRLKPDLVFMDIQIPGPNGIQVVQQISHKPHVVFTTAFDHHAIEAFELHSVDYLLKPIDEKRFAVTMDRLKELETKEPLREEVLQNLLTRIFPLKSMTSITVKLNDRILFIPLKEITHFFADEKYVTLNTIESKEHVIDYTINSLTEKLPEDFIRISRSVIVNIELIREAHKLFRRKFKVILKDARNSSVETGSKYVDNFVKLMNL
jgi:two-component system LytT family response regulator